MSPMTPSPRALLLLLAAALAAAAAAAPPLPLPGAPEDPIARARGELSMEAEQAWSRLYPLLREGGSDAEVALLKYIERYEQATVTVEGQQLPAEVPHLAEAWELLETLHTGQEIGWRVGGQIGTRFGLKVERTLGHPALHAAGAEVSLLGPIFSTDGDVDLGLGGELSLDFALSGRWQLGLGLGGGLVDFSEPFVAASTAAQLSPEGPLQLSFGIGLGQNLSTATPLILPELTLGFLW